MLVHGVAVSSRYLVPLAEHLAPRARVYVPDLPGYGLSDRPAGRDLTVPELADALLGWMDRVGLDRPHLLGNSFGCQVIVNPRAVPPHRPPAATYANHRLNDSSSGRIAFSGCDRPE